MPSPRTSSSRLWGQYEVIGFLGDRYFAAYDNVVTQGMVDAGEDVPFLADKSRNDNLMTNEQISNVLIDDNKEMTITSANPLTLTEGYSLAIKSIDAEGIRTYLELTKNGQVVDNKVIQPSIYNAMMGDSTYYYKADLGDTKEILHIAIHFKNAFRGSNTNIATIDGEFQISDTPTALKSEQQYGKMSIRNVDATAMKITMDNKDNQVTLSKNKDIVLMQTIHVKTANQEVIDPQHPLRYYIYKNYSEPGMYQLRGSVADLAFPEFTWTDATFSGFYYDIDKNIGAEKLTSRLTNVGVGMDSATLSDQQDPATGFRGVTYTTSAQSKNFQFRDWGLFDAIVFLGEPYFVSYKDNIAGISAILEYANNSNLLEFGHLTKVLLDSGKEKVVSLGSSVELVNGYSLKPTVGSDNKGILVELLNQGKVADRTTIIPPDTYVYKTNVGNATGFPVIAAHFEEPVYVEGKGYCKIDGLWQISETPLTIVRGAQYDKLTLETIDPVAMIITMDNKDNQITLSKNKDIVLMQNIHIRTADQNTITYDMPLRYYIYKLVDLASPGGK